jgi:hypothetical protein
VSHSPRTTPKKEQKSGSAYMMGMEARALQYLARVSRAQAATQPRDHARLQRFLAIRSEFLD